MSLAHKLLLNLDPERAHTIGKWAMKHKLGAPGRYSNNRVVVPNFFGHALDNPLILAAGFDKNGDLVDVVRDYGFAFVEVGSVTFNGGPGNKKPRLFRAFDGHNYDLINRMGLNGDPAIKVVERLIHTKNPYAINITKTHDPNIVGDKAIKDILDTYDLVNTYLEPLSNLIYVAVNPSCPNTKEGKTFESPMALLELMSEIKKRQGEKPKIVKLSPNLDSTNRTNIVEAIDHLVDGYICSNTAPIDHPKYGKGGLSGQTLTKNTIEVLEKMYKLTNKPIIACGGIDSGNYAYHAMMKKAVAVQAFSGFVVGPNSGPKFAHKVLEKLTNLRSPSFQQSAAHLRSKPLKKYHNIAEKVKK
tara:strand:- start:32326 stop:33399 length:1074 start_codon:yes stop_codon:yes gene_type:complete